MNCAPHRRIFGGNLQVLLERNMAASLGTDGVPAAAQLSVSDKTAAANLLSLAGDALCLAVRALRLQEVGPQHVSLAEVACHDSAADCWLVVFDKVYDLTAFLSKHPGGAEILLEYAGRDASLAFQGIGHGAAMLEVLEDYLVGALPPAERLFDAAGRIKPAKL